MIKINTPYCVFVMLVTEITTFVSFGMVLAALNPTKSSIEVFINSSHVIRYGEPASATFTKLIITLSQAMLIVGTVVGSIIVRFLMAKLSRKENMLSVHVVMIISAICMGPMPPILNSYEILIVGRFLTGISRGLAFAACPLYIAETANRQTLFLWQSPSGWLIQLGALLGNGIGHAKVMGGEELWPYFMIIPGLFSLVYVACYHWLPETPPYLLRQKGKPEAQRDSEALALLTKLRTGSPDVLEKELQALKEEIAADASVEKASVVQIAKDPKYRMQLLVCIMLMSSLQAVGIQLISQYTDDIFINANIPKEYATYASIGTFGFSLLASFCGTFFLLRVGGRTSMITGLSVSSVALIGLAIATFGKAMPSMAYLSVVATVIYLAGVAIGPSLTFFSLSSELTTQVVRPSALWVAGIVFWCEGSIVSFGAPYMLQATGGFTYILFLALILLVITFIFRVVPDTRGKSAAEIQRQLAKDPDVDSTPMLEVAKQEV
ncbi:solute carrier family 2, facilitated glucose transporter member 1-like isoform X1 [Ciona intestinalis]